MVSPKRDLRKRKQSTVSAGFVRVFHPEEKRNPRFADREKLNVSIARGFDRERYWTTYSTPLQSVEKKLGFKISRFVRGKLGLLGGSSRGFSVLELGGGDARALGDLRALFPSKSLRLVGHVLERAEGEKYEGADRLLVGELRHLKPIESFDLIFSSAASAVSHTILKETAVKKTVEWLKPGGYGVLHVSPSLENWADLMSRIKTVLLQNGIKKFKVAKGVLFFRKPVPKLP